MATHCQSDSKVAITTDETTNGEGSAKGLDHQLADLKHLGEKPFSSDVYLNQNATDRWVDWLVSGESLDLFIWHGPEDVLIVRDRVNWSDNIAQVNGKTFLQQSPQFQELWQNPSSEMPVVGLLETPRGFLLIAMQSAIAPPGTTQEKLRILLLGRYLNPTTWAALSQSEPLSLNLHPLNRGEFTPKLQQLSPWLKTALVTELNQKSPPVAFTASLAKSAPILVLPGSENISTGYTVVPDIYGQPLFLLEVQLDPEGEKNQVISNRDLIWLAIGLGLGFNLVILLLIDKLLLQKLTKFSEDVR